MHGPLWNSINAVDLGLYSTMNYSSSSFSFFWFFSFSLPLKSSSLALFSQKFSPVKTLEGTTTTEKWEFDSVLMEFVFLQKTGKFVTEYSFLKTCSTKWRNLATKEKGLPSHDFVPACDIPFLIDSWINGWSWAIDFCSTCDFRWFFHRPMMVREQETVGCGQS